MNLLSWLLFGVVLGSIALFSSSKRSSFTIFAVGINSILFGVLLAQTIIQKGIGGVNLFPFVLATISILGFISLQRALRLV